MSKVSLMIVEDEGLIAKAIQKMLRTLGYGIAAVVPSGEEAIDKVPETHPDLVLMDIRLGGRLDGIETAQIIRDRFAVPVIYVTAHSDRATLQRAKIAEPFGYILKPIDIRELSSTVEIALYKARTEEKIRQANQKLKEFAHVISHDLKAPLHTMGSLANWLAEDYAAQLDNQGKEIIEMLVNHINDTETLVDAVLRYSSVDHADEECVSVQMNKLVRAVVHRIAPPQNIKVVVDDLPVVHCEKTRMEQVFQNLVDNAVKFMDKPQGRIRVGCIDSGSCWTFSVADNGPGIAERDYEKIFQIFQTAGHQGQSDSTGIGLTIVKKIVEMCGGKIWVDSRVGYGSTFYFTVPKRRGAANTELN